MAVTLTADMQEVVDKLRRAIGDIDEEQMFTDEVLYEYVLDAVDTLELGDYKKGVAVANGGFIDTTGQPIEVTEQNKVVYCLMAHIIIKLGIKDKADRENFSLSKGKLRVDTSGQSADHAVTLEILQKRLRQAIYNANPIEGMRVE